jgi:hypothetical protein
LADKIDQSSSNGTIENKGVARAFGTILASVYKINPIGNKYSAGLSPDVVKHLQTVAWETSQAFHAKHGRGSLN